MQAPGILKSVLKYNVETVSVLYFNTSKKWTEILPLQNAKCPLCGDNAATRAWSHSANPQSLGWNSGWQRACAPLQCRPSGRMGSFGTAPRSCEVPPGVPWSWSCCMGGPQSRCDTAVLSLFRGFIIFIIIYFYYYYLLSTNNVHAYTFHRRGRGRGRGRKNYLFL